MFPDWPQEAVEAMKGVYEVSIAPFGRELPTSSSSTTFPRQGLKMMLIGHAVIIH